MLGPSTGASIFSALGQSLGDFSKSLMPFLLQQQQRAQQQDQQAGRDAKQQAAQMMQQLQKQRLTPGLDDATAQAIDAQINRLSPIISMPDDQAGRAMQQLNKPMGTQAPDLMSSLHPVNAQGQPNFVAGTPMGMMLSNTPETAVTNTGVSADNTVAMTPKKFFDLVTSGSPEAAKFASTWASTNWDKDGKPTSDTAQQIEQAMPGIGQVYARQAIRGEKVADAQATTAQNQANIGTITLETLPDKLKTELGTLQTDLKLKQGQVDLFTQTFDSLLQEAQNKAALSSLDVDKAKATLQSVIKEAAARAGIAENQATELAATLGDKLTISKNQATASGQAVAKNELDIQNLKTMLPLQAKDAAVKFAASLKDPAYWDSPDGKAVAEAAGIDPATLKTTTQFASDTGNADLAYRNAQTKLAGLSAQDMQLKVENGQALQADEVAAQRAQYQFNKTKFDTDMAYYATLAKTGNTETLAKLAATGTINSDAMAEILKGAPIDDKTAQSLVTSAGREYVLAGNRPVAEAMKTVDQIMKSPPLNPDGSVTVGGVKMSAADAQIKTIKDILSKAGADNATINGLAQATRNAWNTYYQTKDQAQLKSDLENNYRDVQTKLVYAQIDNIKTMQNIDWARVGLEKDRLATDKYRIDLQNKVDWARVTDSVKGTRNYELQGALSFMKSEGAALAAARADLTQQLSAARAKSANAGCSGPNALMKQGECGAIGNEIAGLQAKINNNAQGTRDYFKNLQTIGDKLGLKISDSSFGGVSDLTGSGGTTTGTTGSTSGATTINIPPAVTIPSGWKPQGTDPSALIQQAGVAASQGNWNEAVYNLQYLADHTSDPAQKQKVLDKLAQYMPLYSPPAPAAR